MQAILYTIPMAPLDLSSHLALMRGQLFPAIHPPFSPARSHSRLVLRPRVGGLEKQTIYFTLAVLKILTSIISGVGGSDDDVDGDDGDEAE